MALLGKKKQSESVVDARKTITNGVVITVYMESITTRSKKTEPHSNLRRPIAAGTHGYDRRALLLEYSQHLRHAGSENVQFISNQPQHETKSKQKGVWLNQPVRISSSDRCGNESVASKQSKEGERKSSWKSSPQILGKMKNMWKQLSCKEI